MRPPGGYTPKVYALPSSRSYCVFIHPALAGYISGAPRMRLQRVMDYVQNNIGVDLSLSELSAIAEISGSYLKVLFKRSTGVPVHQYVMRTRVEQALVLVMRTNVPLRDIAAQCGFADQSHLTRSFRRQYGITPAQLRR